LLKKKALQMKSVTPESTRSMKFLRTSQFVSPKSKCIFMLAKLAAHLPLSGFVMARPTSGQYIGSFCIRAGPFFLFFNSLKAPTAGNTGAFPRA
jgi:hypothetical protein